jgi:hypothetical protein
MRSFLTVSLSLLAATAASAAPGDPRVIQGTLVWPLVLGDEKLMIVEGSDGTRYFGELSSAHNVARAPMRAGDTVAFAGLEGQRPNEIEVAAVGPDGAVTITASRAALPRAMAQAPARQAANEPAAMIGDWKRLDGVIEGLAGATMELRTRDGKRVSIDLSQSNQPHWLRPGTEVTVYGHARTDGGLVAVGFVQREPLGQALPRSVR